MDSGVCYYKLFRTGEWSLANYLFQLYSGFPSMKDKHLEHTTWILKSSLPINSHQDAKQRSPQYSAPQYLYSASQYSAPQYSAPQFSYSTTVFCSTVFVFCSQYSAPQYSGTLHEYVSTQFKHPLVAGTHYVQFCMRKRPLQPVELIASSPIQILETGLTIQP